MKKILYLLLFVTGLSQAQVVTNPSSIATITSPYSQLKPLLIPTKNLFNQFWVLPGFSFTTAGVSTANVNGVLSQPIPIAAGVSFTISGMTSNSLKQIVYYDNTNTKISNVSIATQPFTTTTPVNTSYLIFTAKQVAGEQLTATQLEIGSSATTYTNYYPSQTIIESGTSITNNYISGGTDFRTLFKNAFQSGTGALLTVINGGVTGQTSTGMLTNLPALLSANPTAKWVFLETSINDAQTANIPIYVSESNLRAMITLVQNAGMQAILRTCLPIDPLAAGSGAASMDIAKRQALIIMARKVAKELNLPLSDWDLGFAGRTDTLVLKDALHPRSPMGTTLVSEIDMKAFFQGGTIWKPKESFREEDLIIIS